MPLTACTIVSNNYLAYARTLVASFRAHHPDAAFHVLVVDEPHPEVDYAAEPFTVSFARDLPLPAFRHLAFRYSILELNTAVKPALLRHLHHTTGCGRLLYFDPDILVLAPIDALDARLAEAQVVLTPHVTAPVEDGFVPGERDFLLSGIYNLGFVGFRLDADTLAFLDWWHRRLMRECLHAVERGLFVDQRWMDFAPAFLPRAQVVRDPGYNVAYWNLVHRVLERRGDGWRVDGEPVRFFHFSGFDLARPDLVSRFQNRFTLDGRPDVAPLYREYARLLREHGHEELRELPYAYGSFDDGQPISSCARRLLQNLDPDGRRWPDPFATAGDSYRAWLAGPDDPDEPVRLPRIAAALWEDRADIRAAFPALRGAPRAAYAGWLVEHGWKQLGDGYLDGVEESLRPPPRPSPEQRALARAAAIVERHLGADGKLACGDLTPGELAFLADPAGDPEARPRLTRLGHVLHCQREDLRTSYPDPFDADRLPFALWYVQDAAAEYGLTAELVDPVRRELPAWKRLRSRRRPRVARATAAPPAAPEPGAGESPAGRELLAPGVNVFGWVAAPTGVGQVCRGSIAALQQLGVPHAVWSLGAHAFEEFGSGAAGGAGGDGAPFDVNLLHVNADMTAAVAEGVPRWAMAGRHRIGVWFWELAYFPRELATAYRHLDELWAPTRFCADAFRPTCPVELRWMPPAVPEPRPAEPARSALGVPQDAFVFAFAFDALSVPERKNPLGLLEAFQRTWLESPVPVHLLLKVSHPEAAPELVAELGRRCGGGATVIAQTLDRRGVDALLASCDAYVSLHRSEGLGLSLIEAMYLGKPVIATGYGGVTDFLDEEVGWVVPHVLVPLARDHGPYPAGAVWAEPDLRVAAERMLAVANSADERAGRAQAGRERVRSVYSVDAAARRLGGELARLRERQRRTGGGLRGDGDGEGAAGYQSRPVS